MGCCCTCAREAVSKKKRRYKVDQNSENKDEVPKGGVNLDLTRVHPNVVCMGFPASGFEAWYRNPYEEVLKYLDYAYPNRYKVYNLCSEKQHQYDLEKYFHGHCAAFPFKDMTPCTLETIPRFVDDAMNHIQQGYPTSSTVGVVDGNGAEESNEPTAESNEVPQDSSRTVNVVAIHCKAGKGRTGLMACCMLLALNRETLDAEASLEEYAKQRTLDNKGLNHRSQRRYVRYYSQLLVHSNGQLPQFIPKVNLQRVEFQFLLQQIGTSKVQFVSFMTYQPAYKRYTVEIKDETDGVVINRENGSLEVDLRKASLHTSDEDSSEVGSLSPPLSNGLFVQGDLRVELLSKVGAKWVGALQVHTLFIEQHYNYKEVDSLYKCKKLPDEAKISLHYTETG